MNLIIFFLGLVIGISNLSIGVCKYPIGKLRSDGHGVMYMFQTKEKNSLFICNESMDDEPVLCCQYDPCHVSILADGKGFSFVDNDLLYIKQYMIRSPRLIDWSLGLYGLGSVKWIDTDRGYFSAMLGHWMGLFELNIANNDEVKILAWDEKIDYYAPCKGENYLFYAERKIDNNELHFSLIRTLYGITPSLKEPVFDSIVSTIMHIEAISDEDIFFTTGEIDKNDVSCSYYHAIKKSFSWNIEKLFNFFIPKDVLDPIKGDVADFFAQLMPRQYGNMILFVSAEQQKLKLFLYDCITKDILPMIHNQKFYQEFVPMIINDTLYYGGIT